MEADWISTGDLGEITENGALKVIDRVSNVYKLTQGEQIHPLKLEHIYMQSEFVNQIYVHGDDSKDYLVGIVVLNKAYADRLIAERNPPKAAPTITVDPPAEGETKPEETLEQAPEDAPAQVDYTEILGDMKVKLVVFDDLTRLASFHKLAPEEHLKNIELTMDNLSPC